MVLIIVSHVRSAMLLPSQQSLLFYNKYYPELVHFEELHTHFEDLYNHVCNFVPSLFTRGSELYTSLNKNMIQNMLRYQFVNLTEVNVFNQLVVWACAHIAVQEIKEQCDATKHFYYIVSFNDAGRVAIGSVIDPRKVISTPLKPGQTCICVNCIKKYLYECLSSVRFEYMLMEDIAFDVEESKLFDNKEMLDIIRTVVNGCAIPYTIMGKKYSARRLDRKKIKFNCETSTTFVHQVGLESLSSPEMLRFSDVMFMGFAWNVGVMSCCIDHNQTIFFYLYNVDIENGNVLIDPLPLTMRFELINHLDTKKSKVYTISKVWRDEKAYGFYDAIKTDDIKSQEGWLKDGKFT
ncbi:hypothetical protein AKO1_014461, partial [Acrasis kona]